jgi:hypothetical protein
MRDYRENRKFALRVRDLVAAGQPEEARLLAVTQVCVCVVCVVLCCLVCACMPTFKRACVCVFFVCVVCCTFCAVSVVLSAWFCAGDCVMQKIQFESRGMCVTQKLQSQSRRSTAALL